MTLSLIVQVLGWLAVLWLIGVHLLIHQGRIHRSGAAPRLAGVFAALIIVVAGLLAEIWPVFVLGLLWLRSELWHRHSPDDSWFPPPAEPEHLDLPEAEVTHESHPAGQAPEAPPAPAPDHPLPSGRSSHPLSGPSGGTTTTRPRTAVPAARTGSSARVSSHPAGRPGGRAEPARPEHHRRPIVPKHLVDVMFRIEMTLLILVTLAAFAFWSYQERPGFARRANNSLCQLMGGCPNNP